MLKERLAEEIFDFARSTIVGGERGLYRRLREGLVSWTTNQPETYQRIFGGFYVGYFNDAYRALITGSDQYFVDCFGRMHKILGHSYICLLNLVAIITTSLHKNLARPALRTKDLEDLERSVEEQIDEMIDTLRPDLARMVSHKCNGGDIKKCDPDEPMFVSIDELAVKPPTGGGSPTGGGASRK